MPIRRSFGMRAKSFQNSQLGAKKNRVTNATLNVRKMLLRILFFHKALNTNGLSTLSDFYKIDIRTQISRWQR